MAEVDIRLVKLVETLVPLRMQTLSRVHSSMDKSFEFAARRAIRRWLGHQFTVVPEYVLAERRSGTKQ